MGKYVENHLNKNETLVKKADRNGLFLLATWIKGILFCWLFLIPLIKAIAETIRFRAVELAVTSKRVVGKIGFANSQIMDSPLNKVQNVTVISSLGGKIFNYGTIEVTTASDKYLFGAIKNADAFKNIVMAQVEQYEEDRMMQQAQMMASAMSGTAPKN